HQGVSNGTLVIRTGFAAWVDGQGTGTPAEAESVAAADEDGDGLPALLEYALGLDPEVKEPSPVGVEIAPQGGLSLTFPSIADPGLVYTVEVADDPAGPWRTLDVPGNPISGGAVAAGTHTVTDSEPADGRPRRFLRLRVAY
ncbi:MAG: hypothetical protein MUE42_13725, partial [Opitutaceae bacterium]|nr:hypothetical protein [Opitutaceae bacterium]